MLGDFFINLAASLAYDLIRRGLTRLRRAAWGDEEAQALQRLYERAFVNALTQTAAHLAPDQQTHLSDLLRRFVTDEQVNTLLLDIALAQSEPPPGLLRQRFQEAGFAPDTLPLDFEQMMTGFVHSLREGLREEAGRPQSPLYNRFAVDRLERVSHSQEELVILFHQILVGQREALERWKGLDEQFARLLSALEQALGQRAVSIGGDATGSIIITGDNARITIPDEGLLASRYQAFLREPQQALQQYLSIVANLYQHLYFPLGRIAGPLRLDEVYTPLALIKPAGIEALLRHRGAGAPPGKRIRRVDELFRYGKPAALAGILGAGKTTTLQYLAWVYARRPENRSYWGRDTLIPFYVYAHDLAACWDERTPFPDALAQAAARARGRQLLDPLLVKSVLHDALEQKVALILIDALDEFRPSSEAERERFITALQAQWAIPPFKGNLLLLTSRPYRFLNPGGFEQYALGTPAVDHFAYRLGRAILQARDDLSEPAQRAWLEGLTERLASPHLREFSQPFYITLLVALGTGEETAEKSLAWVDGVRRLSDIYRFFLRKTVEWERLKPGRTLSDETDNAIRVFSHLAYDAFLHRDRVAQTDSQRERIAAATGLSASQVAHILNFWQETNLLWLDDRDATWQFYHSGFQAFGVAQVLAERPDEASQLRARYEMDPEWETIWELFFSLRGLKADEP